MTVTDLCCYNQGMHGAAMADTRTDLEHEASVHV